MMAQTTFANCRGIAHAGSGGMSVAFPNVCKTSTPAGMIPIPYPNIGQVADIVGGPTTVTCDGEMPMVKGAKYGKSSGDEAGSGGGVSSGVNSGEAVFITYSADVYFEGNNVGRLGDSLSHNKKNALG